MRALATLDVLLAQSDSIVAHNMAFDWPVLHAAYVRERIDPVLLFRPAMCSMETLTNIMELPGLFGKQFKWPTLAEAYAEYVDPAGFEGAHDAMVDVSCPS